MKDYSKSINDLRDEMTKEMHDLLGEETIVYEGSTGPEIAYGEDGFDKVARMDILGIKTKYESNVLGWEEISTDDLVTLVGAVRKWGGLV